MLNLKCRLFELESGERASVSAAAQMYINMTSGYKLVYGTMIAGWDKTGPRLFYTDNDGTKLEGKVFSNGSGSPYAYGIVDSYLRDDMTVDEAVALGTLPPPQPPTI